MDYNEIQFCDDHGHCICGNDCGAGCCSTEKPCEAHAAARAEERAYWDAWMDEQQDTISDNGDARDTAAEWPPTPSGIDWNAPITPLTPEQMQDIQDRAKAKFVYLGQPYTVSWCDSEKGWSECACGIIWHYKSACSIPIETWSHANHCSGDEHSVFFSYVFADCHCGGGDPYIEHPCIGHDRHTGEPLLGPSKFIDYADRRY